MITQAELKEKLHYNPDTGVFTWIKNVGSRARSGNEAGCSDAHGYILIRINGSMYKAHRLAFIYMGKSLPDQVDHINHDTSDNRWVNLGISSNLLNGKNQSMHSNNSTGVTGVYWYKKTSKWTARIKVNYKGIYLGLYKDKSEAIKARKAAELKYGFHTNHGCGFEVDHKLAKAKVDSD